MASDNSSVAPKILYSITKRCTVATLCFPTHQSLQGVNYSHLHSSFCLTLHFWHRHEARDIIRNATQASEHDRIVFVGSGATGAIHKLIHGLALNSPPVVMVGPFAHHSSLLPWRELGAKVCGCVLCVYFIIIIVV